jgi:hypothetical protein
MSQLIRVAHHKGVESIAWVEGIGLLSPLIPDREQNLIGGALKSANGPIDDRPVGFLQRGDKALVGSAQNELVLALGFDLQGTKPSANLFGREGPVELV